ncbi:MAG: ATP-binding protein [Methylovirgula sp.]|jgi:PAS domain S-box-containing protein
MNAYFSESGLSQDDVEAALQALSLSKSETVPLLAVSEGGSGGPGRVILANEPMLALFRATDLDQISERLFKSSDPGAKRLAELSRTLPSEAAPRLERLRFFFGPVVETVTFLCRKSAIGGGEPVLIAAALGARTPRQPDVAPALDEPAPQTLAEPAIEPAPQTDVMETNVEQPVSAAAAGAISLEEIKSQLCARLGDSKTVRFLWRTDADDTITEITPPLAEVVGYAAADLLGRDFGDVAKYLEKEPDGPLARAFRQRETFSGIDVLWPISGAAAAVPVSLGALPAFKSDRSFDGYRGFGVIRVDRLVAAVPRAFLDGPSHTQEPEPQSVANNVVRLRPLADKQSVQGRNSEPLSDEEETAFREIAAALAEEAAKAETAAAVPVGGATEKTQSDIAHQASISESLARNAAMIFDRLGIGILISRDDVPIYTNRFLLDFLGYADEDAFHAAGGMARIFEQVRIGGDTVGLRMASGEIAAVRGRLQMIDWDGMPATLITLRPDEEKELRNKLESEMRGLRSDADELTAILDTATDGLALIDGEGRILALNRSAEALFGYYDQAEVVGKPFTILLARDSQEKAQQYFEGLKSDAVASLLNDGREVIGQPRQGGTIPVFLTLGRIGAGSALKYCALLRDMTHWKKVEEELDAARREAERASALKSDFLAKVSHEIRTPLNAILGFAEVIMEERFGPIGNERYRDYLKDIHTSGAHVMSLVNDLLDLSKIEAGRLDLDFVAVDPNQVITECVGLMQPQANSERVIMRLALAPHLPKILADKRSLRQIILNLLSNAVKFNEPGGQVIIATALSDDGHAVIRIRDTGIGMSEDDLETALEPFRQLATSRQTTGTGLGLPLTKALVEANRAFFSIKSKKNEGTLVEIAFPPARHLSRDTLSA